MQVHKLDLGGIMCIVNIIRKNNIKKLIKSMWNVLTYAFRGQIIRNMGDSLSSELRECLPIFLERLKNEITRLTAVKALTMIAG